MGGRWVVVGLWLVLSVVVAGRNPHADEGWLFSHSGNGLINTFTPINFPSCLETPGIDCYSWDAWSSSLGFKSAHPGGAHFVMGDASVHFIPDSIDPLAYAWLGGKADGQVATFSF